MAENSSTSPATAGNTSITGTAAADSLSGGGGSDTITGGAGADRLSGDAPLPGQWQYSVYTYNFGAADNQTQFISSGTLVGNGYVDDFAVRALRNTISGTAAGNDRDDYGVIYRSSLGITTSGTYTFSTTSDDGSRIIIRDSAGNIVFNLNNDFHQGATTRSGTVSLTAGQSYTIEVYFWENEGADTLSATIAGPGFSSTDLATSALLQTPPLAPGHVDGADSILGDAGADTITGGGGDDRLYGGADADLIYGDAGQDHLYGGTGQDVLFGGTGNDFLWGDAGNDLLYGGVGNDTLYGGADADLLYGGEDNDLVAGNDGVDLIYGEAGNDTLYGGAANDTVFGGAGNDLIYGDEASDSLFGGAESDTLFGGTGDDLLYGDEAADTLFGGTENDTLFGGLGTDILYGGAGRDVIFGGDDQDLIYMTFNDALGNEIVDGGSGGIDNDTLVVDITGFGWARVDLTYDPGNLENGTITFFAANGTTVIATLTFTDIENLVVVCFTAGTQILTDCGLVAVEDLSTGDLVLTRDNGMQPLRWVGQRRLSYLQLLARPHLQPVRIPVGALFGLGPDRTMLLSPQHRVLIESAWAEIYFGEPEVFVPAKHLIGIGEVACALPAEGVTYVHILFDRHEIVMSDGIWTESFQPAEQTLSSLDRLAKDEVLELFPELADGRKAFQAARRTLKVYEAKVLISR